MNSISFNAVKTGFVSTAYKIMIKKIPEYSEINCNDNSNSEKKISQCPSCAQSICVQSSPRNTHSSGMSNIQDGIGILN